MEIVIIDNMNAISYCKKYTIGHSRLEALLNKAITSDYIRGGVICLPKQFKAYKKGQE